YQVLNIGTGCPMDCVYCILQAYLNTPYLTFFVNTDDLLAELAEACAQTDRPMLRIGTGEFTDSMALDRITGLSRKLVSFFAGQDRAFLELKSKGAYVDNLEDLNHNGRTIVAWSLNSPLIAAGQELRTASLTERLQAAARCASWGYPLAFHFDPIIDHQGWQQGYQTVIDDLFAAVPASSIRWISLGAFRFIPKLKQIGCERFPRSTIYHHEFVPGLDSKQRYFRSLRTTLYREIYQQLHRRCDPQTCIYFCMESDEMWRAVMGFCPAEQGGLPAMLDRAAGG
ncbi:MAG: DNA photolyase, partial [Desulfofustis sp.]|nr:DNA photolyase [Desulfofustis sp.]